MKSELSISSGFNLCKTESISLVYLKSELSISSGFNLCKTESISLVYLKSELSISSGFNLCKTESISLVYLKSELSISSSRCSSCKEGNVVQVNSWVATSGKNGMWGDWIVHDCKTGDILTRASRLSKIPDEVRVEIGLYFVDSPPVLDEDSRKLPKLNENTIDYIRIGLTGFLLAIAAGLGALIHTLGSLVPMIGVSGFATAATVTATAIGTVVGSFR
ncbi:hypothetical protein TEA_023557 [Camellia sinensis var. sinensis]|uniref:Uncharacterized protein n=1 Tax=Camellia sinensis var. sinensis TaxID=542762 RepID=A0A4S4D822_CAMSN|nr:hypothetical protein TEA_023557 [Camellia sinensis var. sinensis]